MLFLFSGSSDLVVRRGTNNLSKILIGDFLLNLSKISRSAYRLEAPVTVDPMYSLHGWNPYPGPQTRLPPVPPCLAARLTCRWVFAVHKRFLLVHVHLESFSGMLPWLLLHSVHWPERRRRQHNPRTQERRFLSGLCFIWRNTPFLWEASMDGCDHAKASLFRGWSNRLGDSTFSNPTAVLFCCCCCFCFLLRKQILPNIVTSKREHLSGQEQHKRQNPEPLISSFGSNFEHTQIAQTFLLLSFWTLHRECTDCANFKYQAFDLFCCHTGTLQWIVRLFGGGFQHAEFWVLGTHREPHPKTGPRNQPFREGRNQTVHHNHFQYSHHDSHTQYVVISFDFLGETFTCRVERHSFMNSCNEQQIIWPLWPTSSWCFSGLDQSSLFQRATLKSCWFVTSNCRFAACLGDSKYTEYKNKYVLGGVEQKTRKTLRSCLVSYLSSFGLCGASDKGRWWTIFLQDSGPLTGLSMNNPSLRQDPESTS